MRRTYSHGERVLGKFSGTVEGMVSMLGRPRWERICLRRGLEEARITRLERRSAREGSSRGGGRGRSGGLTWGGAEVEEAEAEDAS